MPTEGERQMLDQYSKAELAAQARAKQLSGYSTLNKRQLATLLAPGNLEKARALSAARSPEEQARDLRRRARVPETINDYRPRGTDFIGVDYPRRGKFASAGANVTPLAATAPTAPSTIPGVQGPPVVQTNKGPVVAPKAAPPPPPAPNAGVAERAENAINALSAAAQNLDAPPVPVTKELLEELEAMVKNNTANIDQVQFVQQAKSSGWWEKVTGYIPTGTGLLAGTSAVAALAAYLGGGIDASTALTAVSAVRQAAAIYQGTSAQLALPTGLENAPLALPTGLEV